MDALTVLPVGNGACSVLQHSHSPWESSASPGSAVSIVDCGGASGTGRSPAEQLDAVLSRSDGEPLDSLVLTHWDADHWGAVWISGAVATPMNSRKRVLTESARILSLTTRRLTAGSPCLQPPIPQPARPASVSYHRPVQAALRPPSGRLFRRSRLRRLPPATDGHRRDWPDFG